MSEKESKIWACQVQVPLGTRVNKNATEICSVTNRFVLSQVTDELIDVPSAAVIVVAIGVIGFLVCCGQRPKSIAVRHNESGTT